MPEVKMTGALPQGDRVDRPVRPHLSLHTDPSHWWPHRPSTKGTATQFDEISHPVCKEPRSEYCCLPSNFAVNIPRARAQCRPPQTDFEAPLTSGLPCPWASPRPGR